MEKPFTLPVRPASIVQEWKGIPRFVLWRWREKESGKWTKPPFQTDGKHADSSAPATWCSFDQAIAAYRQGGFDGIGWVLAQGSGFVGIDLDHCRDSQTGQIDDWAGAIVCCFNSFTEISPSGTGLRILLRGTLPPHGRKRGNFECYESGRYLTLTGWRIENTPATIEPRQEEIEAVHKQVFGDGREGTPHAAAPGPLDYDDEEVVRRALNARSGEKLQRLWAGDIGDYPSTSEAEAALAARLWFFSGDIEQVKRLLLASGLAREKTARPDYLERTVRLVAHGEVYSPSRHMRGHRAVHVPDFEVPL